MITGSKTPRTPSCPDARGMLKGIRCLLPMAQLGERYTYEHIGSTADQVVRLIQRYAVGISCIGEFYQYFDETLHARTCLVVFATVQGRLNIVQLKV